MRKIFTCLSLLALFALSVAAQGQTTINLNEGDKTLQSGIYIISNYTGSNRIIIALVLAAIILASSLLVEGSANHPAIYNLGVTGYIVAIILVALLVLDDLHKRFKKRKRK